MIAFPFWNEERWGIRYHAAVSYMDECACIDDRSPFFLCPIVAFRLERLDPKYSPVFAWVLPGAVLCGRFVGQPTNVLYTAVPSKWLSVLRKCVSSKMKPGVHTRF